MIRSRPMDAPPTTDDIAAPPEPRDVALLAAVQARGEKAETKRSSGTMLLITAGLFIGLGGWQWGWEVVASLLVAIALHEIGHVIAMRCFGYKNVRMLFVPLFGGLATGEPRELDATKNALVALAGPAFGLFTVVLAGGAALLLGSPPWLVNFAWTSLVLNAFNLLPVVPLDGGQFASDALFSRHPVLELAFRLLAIVALGWLAWDSRSWLLGVLPVFMLFSTQLAYRRARLICDARRNPVWQGRPLDATAIGELRALVARWLSAMPAEKYEAKLPEHVHGFWLEIRKRFPDAGITIALLVGYVFLAIVLFPVVAVALSMLLGSPAALE